MRRTHVHPVMLMALAVVSLALLASVAPRAQGKAELALKAAMDKEVVDGDLKAAIEMYRQIASGGDRAVAARALIRMGQCHEKLGDADARKAYERVLREFADQKEAVEQARALLSASNRDRAPESGLAFERKWELPPAVSPSRRPSPDGRYLFFQTKGCLWQHDLTTGEDRRLIQGQPCDSTSSPEVSPDGKQIAYTRLIVKGDVRRYQLWVAGIDGSGVKLVMNDEERRVSQKGSFAAKGWSPDGRHILIVVWGDRTEFPSSSLALVSVTDGAVRVLGARDDFSWGSFSPDGKYLLACSYSRREGQLVAVPGRLKLLPVDGSKEIPLYESPAKTWAPLWTPDGRMIVFLSDRSGTTDLWSLRMSGARAEGEPELVKRDVGPIDLFGFTRVASLYFYTSTLQSDIYTADLDPATGRVISKPTQVNRRFVGSVGYPVEWSPDGQALVYARTQGSYRPRVISLILRSERTGEEREIVPAPAFAPTRRTLYRAQWFPDGRSLLVSDFATGRVVRQVDVQTGQVRTFLDLGENLVKYNLDEPERHLVAPALSRDGKALYYVQLSSSQDGIRLIRRSTESGEESVLFQSKPRVLMLGVSPSPDGRHLAFFQAEPKPSTEDLRYASLMIIPADGGEPRELLRTKIPYFPVTWVGGRHLLTVRESMSGPPELWSVPIGGGEPQPSGLAMPGLFEIAVHPDGNRIAFCRTAGPVAELWVIKNLLSAPKVSR
jgi:Tol biopolymer transport system component